MTSLFGGVDIFVLVSMRGWSATTCGCEEDWLGMSGHLGAAGGLSVMYAKDKISYFKNVLDGWSKGGHFLPTPTSIVDVTMVLVSLIDFFNGFELPDSGDIFGSGYYAFDSVHSTLELAAPDPAQWSGPAAQIYGEENAELAALVQQMQDLDTQMQEQIASQAAVVQQAHTAVGLGVAGLIVAHAIALALYLSPAYGPTVAFSWQLAAAAGICSGVLAFEAKAAEHAQTVADNVQSIGGDYDDLAAKALHVAAATAAGSDANSAPASPLRGSVLPATPLIAAMGDLSAGSVWAQARTGSPLLPGAGGAIRPRGPVISGLPAAPPRLVSRSVNLIEPRLRRRSSETDPAAGVEAAEAGVELTAGSVPDVAASSALWQDSRQLAPIG